MREILTIIAALIVAALVAALAVPPFIDWTKHSAAIADKLGAGFGGAVALEGPVRLRLLPAPRLTAGALRAERPGLVVRARETAIELSAPALLRGAFEFTEIALDRAEVSLDPARLDIADAQDARVAVSRFQLTDSTLRIAGARPLALERLDMNGAADSLAGPFRGSGVARDGRTIEFSFSTAPIEQGALRGKFAFDDRASKTHGEAAGDIAQRNGALEFYGQAVLTGVAAGAPARASFSFKADAERLQADKIDARLGDDDHALNFSGDVDYSRADGLRAQLAAASLDLDRFGAAYRAADVARAGPAMAVRLRLVADSVTLGDDALTNVALEVRRAPDMGFQVAIDAGLPGRTRLHYDGAFDAANVRALDGALNFETRDAAKLAAYLAPAAPQVSRWMSAGAFARLAYDGRVRADTDGVDLDAHALDLDRSRLSGRIEWRATTPDGRSRLVAHLAASTIDVDNLPDLRALASVSAQDDLALSLDAQSLRVARIGEAPAQTGRLRVAFSRGSGVSTLDELSIADLGGANLTGSGRVTAQGGGFDFKLDAVRLADLAALARRVAPGPASEAFVARASALSPAHLAFGIATDAAGVFTQLNLSGEAGGARYSAQAQPSGAGRMQARLSAQASDAATLLRQAGLSVLPLKGLGGARLEATGDGPIGGALQTRAHLDLAGLSLSFDGATTLGLDRAAAEGRLAAESADIAALAPLFAFGVPDPALTIPLRGVARLRADAAGIALSSIEADIADAKANGGLTRDATGRIAGALALDHLSAPWLASLALGPPQPAARAALWPTLKFAPPRFDPPQADLALDVARLDLGADVAARDARLKVALGSGAVLVRDATMKIGDGRIAGDVALRREGGVAMGRARLTATDVATSAGPFSARISGEADVSGAGASMAELVSSLAGSARLTFTDARIARAAPEALARIVTEAEKSETPLEPRAISEALAREFATAAQEFARLDGDATVASGRISFGPVEARLGALDARLSAAYDLRKDAIDVREALRLPPPAGWTSAPHVEIAWSGERSAPARVVNADALIAALAERAIAREIERNAALEADIHERAFFNRRLKTDRRNDEERRAAEEARRREEDENARRALEDAKRLLAPKPPVAPSPSAPARREEPLVQPAPHPKPPPRPPAAFAPAVRGAAPDPSTAGRY